MNICIGVISYLPNEIEHREYRFNKFIKLISRSTELFNKKIVIIAQNYSDEDIKRLTELNSNLIIVRYSNGLGITGARKRLRKFFLESEFDYLIMLDDDSELVGTKQHADRYLEQIEQHPGMFGIFKEKLLKLFAISKDVFKLIDYPDGEAANGDFFEDLYLIDKLTWYLPNKCFRFERKGLNEHSNSANDPHSTWYHRQFNKKEMGNKTRMML